MAEDRKRDQESDDEGSAMGDVVGGRAEQLKGRLEQATGALTGNAGMRNKGDWHATKGKAKATIEAEKKTKAKAEKKGRAGAEKELKQGKKDLQ